MPALGIRRRNYMASLAKARANGRTRRAAARVAQESAKADAMSIPVQEEDEPEGDRLNERVEKRIMDIETGNVKMKRYTFDEYMRHLDDILDG